MTWERVFHRAYRYDTFVATALCMFMGFARLLLVLVPEDSGPVSRHKLFGPLDYALLIC